MAMMAMTTNSSIKVKPGNNDERFRDAGMRRVSFILGVVDTLLDGGIITIYDKCHSKKGGNGDDHQQFNQGKRPPGTFHRPDFLWRAFDKFLSRLLLPAGKTKAIVNVIVISS
jgi:hypothetical protein